MKWDKDNDIIVLVCEGGFEKAIMEILLDKNLLKFNKDMLMLKEFSKYRKARDITRAYLQYDVGNKNIEIVRILDSKNEKFKLKKPYDNKVTNIYTRPEIEILYIISENKYDDFTNKHKSTMKASEYCKIYLGCKDIKKPSFIKEYYSDIDLLINTLKIYKSYSDKKELCIYDLINTQELIN